MPPAIISATGDSGIKSVLAGWEANQHQAFDLLRELPSDGERPFPACLHNLHSAAFDWDLLHTCFLTPPFLVRHLPLARTLTLNPFLSLFPPTLLG